MQLIRYVSFFIISSSLTVLLFILMQKMLSFEKQTTESVQLSGGLDFVRLIREPESVYVRHENKPPEKPKPPEKKPPHSKLPKLKVNKPKIDSIVLPKPELNTKLNLNDALYLGNFHKDIPQKNSVQIDEEVVPLIRIAPRYPSRAARLGIEGWVKMEIIIDSKGAVEKVKVLAARPSNLFNRAAIRAIKQWRFRPKIVSGKAVSRTAEQQINFKLKK